MAEAAQTVCVAIPTFRRADRLRALLTALAGQTPPPATAVTILVLDNDGVASAASIVEEARASVPFELVYRHVPEPGLSMVRNAAIAYARRSFTHLAMIDDDEVPVADWLAELLRIARLTGSEAVIGPVPQVLPDDAPRWMRIGKFYDLPTFADGAPMHFGYSGNCLLDVAFLTRTNVQFDPELNFAGGEDMLFFRELLAAGGRITFAARAVAVEAIPPSRVGAAYLLRLNYRRGNTLAICDRRLLGSGTALVVRAAKALARVGLGLAGLVPLSLVRGRAGAMTALCNIAQGCGGIAGLRGHVYLAYRRAPEAVA